MTEKVVLITSPLCLPCYLVKHREMLCQTGVIGTAEALITLHQIQVIPSLFSRFKKEHAGGIQRP